MQQDKSLLNDKSGKKSQVSFYEDNKGDNSPNVTFRESKLNQRHPSENIFRVTKPNENDDEERISLIEGDVSKTETHKTDFTSKKDDDEGNQDERLVDFDALLKKQQEFTEAAIPFTNHHIEDAIFIDDFHVVALEYIFFHNDEDSKQALEEPKYITLKKKPAHAKVENVDLIKEEEGFTNTGPARPTISDGVNMFENPYEQVEDTKTNYLGTFAKHQKMGRKSTINKDRDANITWKDLLKKKKCQFIETNDKRVICIPMLGKYHINEYGQIMKEDEIDIHFECKFQPSKDMNMRLQLSHDRGRIVLPMVHQNVDKTSITLMAWETHSLRKIPMSNEIKVTLQKLPKGKLIEANFIGINEHVMITLKRETDNHKQSYMEYYIFNSESGHQELRIDNKKNAVMKENLKQMTKNKILNLFSKDKDVHNSKIRFVGILPKPKANRYTLKKQTKKYKSSLAGQATMKAQRKKNEDKENSKSRSLENTGEVDLDFVERDQDEISDTDSLRTDSDEDIQNISADILNNSFLNCTNDLELCFIFISTDVHGTKEEFEDEDLTDRKKEKEEKQKKLTYGEKIYWTRVNLSIIQIVKNGMEDQLSYIMSKAQDQFKQYTQENFEFKQVPKNWFFDKDEKDKNWEGEILICVNRCFNQFGFLNRSQKLYIVYDFNEIEELDDHGHGGYDHAISGQDWLAVHNLPSSANTNVKVFLGRNQYTKEHIYLTIRTQGEGTTTYCYKQNGSKQKIAFSADYDNAIQDATHQNCADKHQAEDMFEEFIFSSITISKDDQEIMMKTSRMSETNKGSVTESLSRKTNSQYQQSMYPVFCYNIGLFKMIIQNTLGNGIQYVLELNQHEAFISFVQFNTFKDIGFNNTDNIDIAGNSHFAFLTFDGKTETLNLNLLFIDIYHEKCDIKLLKSTRVFAIDEYKDKDIMVKAIVYTTDERTSSGTQQGNDYTIKLLAQYPNHINMIEQQEIEKENQIKLFTSLAQIDQAKDDEEVVDENEEVYSSVPMLLEPTRGQMYYVTELAGQCKIYEINPTSDHKINHILVFEIKSENCFGFSEKNGTFLFIDNEKITTVLVRAKESRKLIETQELNLKEKDSPNFLLDQNTQSIVNEKYLIQKTKIFYLFGNKPLQNGLLDMEELAEPRIEPETEDGERPEKSIPIKYVKGPYNFQEANEFGIIIRDDIFINEKREQEPSIFFNMNIAKLPDGRFQQVITDFGKQVDLSTFLNDGEEEKELRMEQFIEAQKDAEKDGEELDYETWTAGHGKILTKIANKWMLFDADCEFINRVNFFDENKQPKEAEPEKTEPETDGSIRSVSMQDEEEKEEGEVSEAPDETLLSPEELKNLNLHAMSENNMFYLFIKETETIRPSFGKVSGSFTEDGSPRPRGSNSIQKGNRSSPSKLLEDISNLNYDSTPNQQRCGVAGHKNMIQTHLQVFALENTGKGDLKAMDLSGLDEYQKMFKRSFQVNILEYPHLFDKEIDQKGNNAVENRQMYIDDDGTVNIIKTWYFPNKPHDHNPNQVIYSKIYSIKKDNSSKLGGFLMENSQYEMTFEKCTLETHKRAFSKLQKKFKLQIKNELKTQHDLPKHLKNNSQIEQLKWNIEVSNTKINNVIKTFLFKNKIEGQMHENILVVKCGKDVKVALVKIGDKQHQADFKNIDCHFEDDVEIVNILSTSVDNEIQIIARDEDKKCLIILTWNFKHDFETSMVQFSINGDTRPGQHCVMGMNTKRNYFANEFYIYDLEFNIPIQNTVNEIKYEAAGQQFRNQRKIFKNSSRSLSLNSESILKLAYNRMDLLYWKNIQELGDSPEVIMENTSLELFNQVFDGYSMFHYFVSNPDIIEFVCKKYLFLKEQNTLTEEQKRIPLLILHLNNDGYSALDDAINTHRPKSFKCMIDLITEVGTDFCLTKLMLNLLQLMIKQGTYMNHGFFDTTSFQPILMQQALIVQWPQGMDDYVFASNTSMITKQQIEQRLVADPHGLDKIEIEDDQNKIVQIDKETDYNQKTGMRNKVLHFNKDSDQTFSRVTTEALDFDWLFEEDNIFQFLELLGSQEDSAIYSKKSIRILIKLLWQKYQPRIKQRVLYPYLAYVISFILLQPYIDVQLSEQFGFFNSIYLLMFKITVISFLYLYFVKFEVDQFIQDPQEYFLDPINQIDIAQYGLNAFIISMVIQDLYLDRKIMEASWKKALYAIACFVMWIKIYYLMRIFSQTAHFITLMARIVEDSQTFMIMLVIILLAFANFFYVVDMGDKDSNYVGLYTDNSIVNVLMEMYFVSLGNFNIGSYSNGDNSGIIWFFFIIASFVIVVVFMNLLISIMGNTLGDVQAVQEQSQIQEQAEMIIEYFVLLDMKEVFLNQKYIIYISKDQNSTQQEDDTQTIIMELKKALFDQLETNQSDLLKRNEGIEKNIRLMSKQHSFVRNNLMSLGSEVKRIKESIETIKTNQTQQMGGGGTTRRSLRSNNANLNM